MDQLATISPIDGRYHGDLNELANYFSEMALMRYRVLVETEYFIALGQEKGIAELEPLTGAQKKKLQSLYQKFSLSDAQEIKKIEKKTNHDVKAVEYFIAKKLQKTDLKKHASFVHFALTSEDVNNIAYSLMWQDALRASYIPSLKNVSRAIQAFAMKHKSLALLSLTHGQSATPTTVGKEFAIFASRLGRQIDNLEKQKFAAKLSGATGTWSAHLVAYPNVDWRSFAKKFIESLGLTPNLLTTQIENHDSLAESFHTIELTNTILIDLVRDIWLYVSRGVFSQKKKPGEVGSSTMPHKINPINFENAEGNLGIANAYLSHLAQKLPISRLQRDLSDSTVLRNQGVPLAHSLLALKNILKGMERVAVNKSKIEQELSERPEVLAEAIQTVLRKHGRKKAYEQLKEATQGKQITRALLNKFIQDLKLPDEEKKKLLKLEPRDYIGLAEKLV